MHGRCKLCGREGVLQLGHIFPRFAVNWLKKTSATGYLRNLTSPKRQQETRREYILCAECEQLLGRDEKTFAERVFVPYHGRRQTAFDYGGWFRRFLAGLHWKVLATRDASFFPDSANRIYSEAEVELRAFLLGESPTPGRADFQVLFVDVIQDADGPMPVKMNWYLARGLDATPTYSDAGSVGIYAKMVKIMTVCFLTPGNPNKERWEGTAIVEQGTIRTPQQIYTASMGPFLEERARAVERASFSLTPRMKQQLLKSVASRPERFLSSESFRTYRDDMQFRQRQLSKRTAREPTKGRDRNQPCPCGSGRKLKNCCGRSGA
jgi:SEC-C motif